MNILKTIQNRKGFTLVELMIVVAIIGILAAIAIPAFLRSVRKSQSAESEQIMRKFADGSKGYFTTEQRRSDATIGDQPWHGIQAGRAGRAGMPVPWGEYVFPGGPNCVLLTSPNPIPSGGAKVIATPEGCGSDDNRNAALNKLGVTLQDPVYFQYNYTSALTAADANVQLVATADFNAGNDAHTARQQITVDPATQEVLVDPVAIENEFE